MRQISSNWTSLIDKCHEESKGMARNITISKREHDCLQRLSNRNKVLPSMTSTSRKYIGFCNFRNYLEVPKIRWCVTFRRKTSMLLESDSVSDEFDEIMDWPKKIILQDDIRMKQNESDLCKDAYGMSKWNIVTNM